MKKIIKAFYRGRYAFYRSIRDLAYKNAIKHSSDTNCHVFLKWLNLHLKCTQKLKKIPLV